MGSYYYLISSLPDIRPEASENKNVDVFELFELIRRNLSKQDLAIYECLLYQHDNRNLLHHIFHEYHHLRVPDYIRPSVIPESVLKNYRRNFSYLPGYMIEFLLDNAGVFGSYSMEDIELKLRSYFFEFVRQQQAEFLTLYYEWQYQLEHVLAEFNQQNFAFLNDINNNDLENLEPLPVRLVSFDHKKLTNDLKPFIENGQYAAVEKLIDTYYWEFGDYWADTFSSNAVFSYTIKLLRLVRWTHASTNTEEKREQFLSLLHQVKSGHEDLNFLQS